MIRSFFKKYCFLMLLGNWFSMVLKKKKAKAKKETKISKKTTFAELLGKYPAAIPIVMESGLHCIGCHAAAFETIEQGALGHGMTEKELEAMMERINKAIKNKK